MQRFKITALQPIEVTATKSGSDLPAILQLASGEVNEGLATVYRIRQACGPGRINVVPHPADIGQRVSLDGLIVIERVAA